MCDVAAAADDHLLPSYHATDNLKDASLVGLLPADLSDIAQVAGIAFDHETGKGVVFHLMGTLSPFGKVGLTAIADSIAEADALYEKACKTMMEVGASEAQSAHSL